MQHDEQEHPDCFSSLSLSLWFSPSIQVLVGTLTRRAGSRGDLGCTRHPKLQWDHTVQHCCLLHPSVELAELMGGRRAAHTRWVHSPLLSPGLNNLQIPVRAWKKWRSNAPFLKVGGVLNRFWQKVNDWNGLSFAASLLLLAPELCFPTVVGINVDQQQLCEQETLI